MYAQLGNIKFETLVGFDSLADTRTTNFAEHPTIDSKPRLQMIGSGLQEVGMSISFHSAFCSPEAQYDELNAAREAGEVLTLVYGNGYVEGDFVITSLGRRVNQTDGNGNYVSITCDVALREFKTDKLGVLQSRAKSAAFAIDIKRPLPVNIAVVPKSPASATQQSINETAKQATFFSRTTDRLKYAQAVGSSLIEEAQLFRDKCQVVQSQLNGYIDKMNLELGKVQDAINIYDIELLCPNIQAQVNACNAVTLDANNIISQFVSFPAVVNTALQATAILATASDVYGVTDQLKEETSKLKDSAQGLAASISSRKQLE